MSLITKLFNKIKAIKNILKELDKALTKIFKRIKL
jgi:hypothetical protein